MRHIWRPPNDSHMQNNNWNEPRGTLYPCVPWVKTHRTSNLWQIDKPIMVCMSITFITRWTCWSRPLTSSGSGGECCVKDGGEEWHRMRLNSHAHKLLPITSSALHTGFTHRYSALCEDALRTFQPAHAALFRPCAVVHRFPGLQTCGCCPQPFSSPGLQLGKPAEIHPPSDNFRLKQLLLGDQSERTCAQNYKPGVLQWVAYT